MPKSSQASNAKCRGIAAEPRTTDYILTCHTNSPIGELILGATDRGICLLEFADRRSLKTELLTLQNIFHSEIVPGKSIHLTQMAAELRRYFNRELRQFSVPIEAPGTPFQMAVWAQLLEIPYGKTISYKRLAENVKRAGAQRCVGQANGSNRIAIVIPCHRVVQSDGSLRGYGGGLWRKKYLLDLESNRLSGAAGSLFQPPQRELELTVSKDNCNNS